MVLIPMLTPRPIIFRPSFQTSILLVILLFYLQLLYAFSFLLRPFSRQRVGPQPLSRIISPAEKQVLAIITDLIPPPVYRSPLSSGAFVNDGLTSPHSMSAYHATQVARIRCDRLVSAPSLLVELAELPRAHSSLQQGRERPARLYENERPHSTATPIRPSPVNEGVYDQSEISHYNGSGQSVPSTTEPSTVLATDQNVPLARPSTSKQTQQQEEEHQIVEVVNGIPVKPAEVKSVEVKPNEVKPADNTHPNTASPTISTGNTKTSLDAIPTFSSHYTDDLATLSLSTNRNVKTRSTESYPGKFPVSEGMEFSSLATASCAFHGRGTTSVRPFSDY